MHATERSMYFEYSAEIHVCLIFLHRFMCKNRVLFLDICKKIILRTHVRGLRVPECPGTDRPVLKLLKTGSVHANIEIKHTRLSFPKHSITIFSSILHTYLWEYLMSSVTVFFRLQIIRK